MYTNSKMAQESKNEWIYFLEEKRHSGNIYAAVAQAEKLITDNPNYYR
ncbi:hypothetical protein NUACC21_16510 [Scytonema sp. NUACC21]